MKKRINNLICIMAAILMAFSLTSCGLLKGVVNATYSQTGSAEQSAETTPSAKSGQALYDEIEEAVKRGDNFIRVRAGSLDEVSNIVEKIRYIPEYFYLGDAIEYSFDGFWCDINFNIRFDNLVEVKAAVRNSANQVISLIPEDADDYTRALIIHDWIITNVEYDDNAPNSQDIYGALVDRRCVCNGYAMTFKYLMELAGLSCEYYAGTAEDERGSGSHAWNSAILDGELYYFDTTWDDPKNGEGRIIRSYFAISYDEMIQRHTPYPEYEMPYSDATACNYFVLNDYVVWEASKEELVRMINMQGRSMEFKCADDQVYQGILELISDGEALYDVIVMADIEANGCLSSKNVDTRVVSLTFY